MRTFVLGLVLALLFAGALCSRVSYSRPALDNYPSDEWAVLGRANAQDITSFRLALYQRNLDQLEQLFWKISDPNDAAYMQYLSPAEAKALVSPPRAVQDRVVDWALEGGAQVAESYGDWVEVRATVEVVEALLATELHVVRDLVVDREELKIVSGSYSLPEEVAAAVEFVQNLNQFSHPRRIGTFGGKDDRASRADTNASEDDVIPETLYTLYDIDYQITTNSSQCVAEFSTFAYKESDMVEFCNGVDIQQPLPITNVGPFNDNIADAECTLDIQYINAVGLNGTSFFWTTKGWILDLAQELLAYSDTPLVVSISWSSDERSDGKEYNFRTDAEIQQLGVTGTSVLAASGDSGAVGTSHCSGNRYPLNPGYPTTSPYVTSVGATMLVGQPTPYTGPASVCTERQFTCAVDGLEDPADENFGGYATGGGFSVYETRPPYQDTVVSQYLNDNSIPKPPSSYFNSSNRGFPDVAANGYNLIMRQNSKWVIVGGTSASTPIWGGIFAIMNDHLALNGKPSIGFANPLLYQMFADGQGTFLNIGNLNTNNDDGCGSTLGYTSNPNGWDPVCGLGTPNVANILAYLDKMMPTLPDAL